MGHKNDGKQSKKEREAEQRRWLKKHPTVTTMVTSAAPVTPIPALTAAALQPQLKIVSTASGEKTVKKWCFDNTPVYHSPEEPWPSISLGRGTVVELTGNKQSASL